MLARAVLLLVLVVATSLTQAYSGDNSYDPSFDHQTTTYTVKYEPVTVTDASFSMQSFFSPDHSADVLVNLINMANTSIDIGTPGLNSWSNCTYFQGSPPSGCTIPEQQNELFPLFPAILNAHNRGVSVRILTNNYNQGPPPGFIDPFTYLFYAGIQIRYYDETTFLHTKYMSVDGKRYSISSINWSYSSYEENREAGVVIWGANAQSMFTFCDDVYNGDWNAAAPFVPNQNYSVKDLEIIRSKSMLPIVMPKPKYFKDAYVTTVANVTGYMTSTMWTSPDYAYTTLIDMLNTATKSVVVYIYQIDTPDLCNWLISFYKNGGDVYILVSNQVFAGWAGSEACYNNLYAAYIDVYLTAPDMYSYSHQKFWIIDGETVVLSTGNWANTDYPNNTSPNYPPFGQPGWTNANRDYTVSFKNQDVADNFMTVYTNDKKNAVLYKPESFAYLNRNNQPW